MHKPTMNRPIWVLALGCMLLVSLVSALPATAASENSRNGGTARSSTVTPQRLQLDGGFHTFGFGRAGTVAAVYRLNTPAEAWLRVTDLYCAGDRFSVIDNGRRLSQTAMPTRRSCRQETGSPRLAERDDRWSSGGWILAPGRHRITIRVTASPFGTGAAIIRADSPSLARARLTGAAEVPGPGDADGFGFSSVIPMRQQGAVCYGVTVRRLDRVVAGHVHAGKPTVAGPIVVDLQLQPGFRVFRSACVPAQRTTIAAIAFAPWDYYVNVHTEAFPDGAIRGQLVPLYWPT